MTIEISLRACGSEHARRRYHPDVTIARKIPVQMLIETHDFEKCS